MSEAAWQRIVVELAHHLGWSHYHTHDSRRSAAGFPDLVLCRERMIFVELKSEVGKLTAEQVEWSAILNKARQEVYLWRPSDLPTAQQVLARR